MSKNVKLTIFGVVVVGLGAIGVLAAKKNSNKATEVRIEGVQKRDLVASVTASGQIGRAHV